MRAFVDLRWFVGLSCAAWACAKATPDTGSDAFTPTSTGGTSQAAGGTVGTTGGSTTGGSTSSGGSTTGGSTGTGGSTASGGAGGSNGVGGTTGGATATGGSNATGGSGARGGSTATGGSNSTGGSSGGSTATGGSTASGGATMTGGGGMASSLTGDGSVIVFYEAVSTTVMSSNVNFSLYLMNQTADALDLSNVEIRYFMTAEPASPATHSYYSVAGLSAKTPTFVAGPPSYLSFTFSKGGTVPAKTKDLQTTEVQGTVDSTMGMFDQSDDWSFNAKDKTPQPNPNVTLYIAGKLTWGCEPSGVCPGGMLPSTSGQGGMPAAGGMSGLPTAGVGGNLGTAGAN